jgi:GMP synthase-like glutamine amidotransferase
MRVLAIVHQADAGSGVFGEVVQEGGHELLTWTPATGVPPTAPVDAALVFGGGMHAGHESCHPWLRGEKRFLRLLLERRTPVLGVCLGSQLLAEVAGGVPREAERPEIGWYEVRLEPAGREDPLLGALPERFEAFSWHSQEFPLPPGATPLARSALCLQGFRLDREDSWGIQFHAEVTRESALAWLESYPSDPSEARAGIDPVGLSAAIQERMDAWNEVGRGICRRFLDHLEG